ncbi:MAG TPA: MG2 domain-containing protein, partial [bacterium]|nr:MG2 domain-containing protein [bacterium]
MRFRRAVALLPLVLLPLSLDACRRGSKGSSQGSASPGATPSGRLTADRLHPVLHAIGGDDALPTKVVFDFSLPVFENAKIGSASRSELKVTPEVPGTLRVGSVSTLEFVPTGSFAFKTGYEFTLTKIETRDGTFLPPTADAWSSSLTTTDFKLVRLAPQPVDTENHRVAVDLVFSGDVDASAVKNFVSVSVGAKNAGDVRVSATDDRRVARLTVTSADLVQGANVKVAVKKGLPPAGKSALRAPSAEMSFAVVTGLPVEMKMAQLKEGATGHYVSVVCNDEAAGGSQYVWDPEVGQEYYVSSRCTPKDASALEHIRFEPKAKFTIAPAQHGFNIYGDFKRGSYTMTVDPGMVTEDGGVVGETFEKSFTIAPRKPTLSFASTGRYLPRSAWKSLGVRHRNVDSATLTIRQIPPENLVFWMSDDSSEAATERTSNQILSKQIALSGEIDEDATTWIDVAGLLPATTRGILEISLSGSGAAPAQARLLLTDMGIVAKRATSGDVNVWAIGLDATNPLPGVELSMIRKSGKVLARCTTDAGGGCQMKEGSSDEDGSPAFAILARKGEDLSYLKYSDLKLGIADSEVQGESYSSAKAYRASIYSDRGVYRPGDTAHLAAILRDDAGVAPPKGLPVALKLTDPRQQLARNVVLKTNEGGMVSLDVPFEAFADTGRWEAKVTVADAEVGNYAFNVEEFVPERMKVVATTPKSGYSLSDSVPVDVDAKYLFGGSAEGSELELTCSIEPAEFHPRQNANWQFGLWQDPSAPRKPISLGQSHGALDEHGHAQMECPSLEAGEAFDGPGRLVANVSVFESGSGRSTFQQATVPVHPAPFYVGLSSSTPKALAGKPVSVDGIVVDWNGDVSKKAPEKVAVEFLRLEPQYGDYWDEEGEGGERYQQQLRPVREGASQAQVGPDGKFHVEITPAEAAAAYVVRVRAGGARTDLYVPGAYEGYVWNLSAQRMDLTPRPGKPTSIVVTGPKTAKSTEPVTISFRSPYKGRALLTAETDRVVASEWKNVSAGENTWTFHLKEFAPNVYVSTFVVKDPHLESASAYMPDRAFGIVSVPVEPTQFVQRVTLDVPTEIRSNSKLTVNLDLGPVDSPTFATVAAVDEGILQLTKFKSPDPVESIFARRALGVETFETIGWTLLMQPSGPTKTHGGDEDDGGGKKNASGRVQPVKPIALWSGIVPVGANGKATVSFDVPTYRGQLRVMAVTSSAKRMGRASAQVQVADPIVVQTTLPRFLTQGDEFQVPVFLTNTTKNPIDVKVSLTAEEIVIPGVESFGEQPDPIKFLGKPEGKTRLEAGKSATMVFQARATKVIGAAKLKVKAVGGGFESTEDLDVPFEPSGPRERSVQKFEVSSSEVDLTGKLGAWIPTSEKTDFWLTSNPWGD